MASVSTDYPVPVILDDLGKPMGIILDCMWERVVVDYHDIKAQSESDDWRSVRFFRGSMGDVEQIGRIRQTLTMLASRARA